MTCEKEYQRWMDEVQNEEILEQKRRLQIENHMS